MAGNFSIFHHQEKERWGQVITITQERLGYHYCLPKTPNIETKTALHDFLLKLKPTLKYRYQLYILKVNPA
jgi:hypothetical protein